MGSLSGAIQRPLMAAFAVAVASEFSDKIPCNPQISQPDPKASFNSLILEDSISSWANSASKSSSSSFLTRIRIPTPNVTFPIPTPNSNSNFSACSSVTASPLLLQLFQSARAVKPPKPGSDSASFRSPPAAEEGLYRWHLPEPGSVERSDCSLEKSRTVVVLLGWLGAKQKHLKRYAEWYTSRGFHAITFTFPLSEVLSYRVGGKAEEHVHSLVQHLADWLQEEDEKEDQSRPAKKLVFHTFSNTGWLTYGAILEEFQKQDPLCTRGIKGCIVDSAPVAAPDPQVWASGFSAAFLKKQSVATKRMVNPGKQELAGPGSEETAELKPAVTETALLLVLEKFFAVVLNLPKVNRRLCDVLGLLSTEQPSCPQLYIYSSADRVIPADCVESFIEKQRRCGRQVRACDFVFTPHVDHFRNNPTLYTSQLTFFFQDCVLTNSCKNNNF